MTYSTVGLKLSPLQFACEKNKCIWWTNRLIICICDRMRVCKGGIIHTLATYQISLQDRLFHWPIMITVRKHAVSPDGGETTCPHQWPFPSFAVITLWHRFILSLYYWHSFSPVYLQQFVCLFYELNLRMDIRWQMLGVVPSYSRLVLTMDLFPLVFAMLMMKLFLPQERFGHFCWSCSHTDQWVRFPAWGFLFVFCTNHSSKTYHSWARGMGPMDWILPMWWQGA